MQLEHIFLLSYYLGFSGEYSEKIPIQYRAWYITRINQEIAKFAENSPGESYSKGAHDHDPDSRSFRGQRPNAPHNLHRFTPG